MIPVPKPSIRAACLLAALSMLIPLTGLLTPARAHVLEGPHILELTAKAMGTFATLKVDQQVTIYPPSPIAVPKTLDERAIYVMPERFRSDINTEQIQRTHLVFADSAITVIDSREAVASDPFDLYQQLLRSRTRPRLIRTLSQLGVETAISSLGRVEDTVVWVLGARYPDESVNQLAVDKETFLPIRLLLVDNRREAPGNRLAIVYRNWKQFKSGWFPMQIHFFTGDQQVRNIRVSHVELNPSISIETMDPEALRSSLAAQAAETPEGRNQEAVDSVQQAVEDFQKKFE